MGDMFDENAYRCLEMQIKCMSIFYLVFSFIDLMLLGIGDVIDRDASKETFLCIDKVYLFPNSEGASYFLIFHNLFFYLFSILIWSIFYKIPDKFGLIKRILAKDLNMRKSIMKDGKLLKESEVVENLRLMSDADTNSFTPAGRKLSV